MNFQTPRKAIAFWLALVASQFAFAAEVVHQTAEGFLDSNLPGCAQKVLWLNAGAKAEIEDLLDRSFAGVRVRYCESDGKTAWVLDEIGKTEPITSGIVVDRGQVEHLQVLVFRESRGGEVHRDAFTRQYEQASLDDSNRLDRQIDGITGATMSVYAVSRQARLALLLDRLARGETQ